jgi:tetratricopeptide (TPR) repeat protein
MTRAKAPARPPRSWMDPGILVAAAALLAFIPALSCGFVWDDVFYIKDNPILRLPPLAAIVPAATRVVVGNYHPLTVASLVLDNALFGPGPLVFHVTNVLLHAVNALLVGRLILALGIRRDAAWAGALLWAVHPLRVESVAWISGRKDLLYVAFFLSALLAYLRHAKAEGGAGPSYAWSLALFTCSALSKGMAVSFVPVIFLVDGLIGRPVTRRSLVEKIPFAALGLAFTIVAVAAQRHAGAIPHVPEFGWWGRIAFACYGLVFYVVKTAVPLGLSAFYPYPKAAGGGLPVVVGLAVVAVAAAAAVLLWKRRAWRIASFAAGFFVATVAMVLQVVPVGSAVAADRYTYLSAVAFSFALAAGLELFPFRRWIVAVVVAAGVLLAGATWARCAVWRDGLTLWNDVLARTPDVWFAHLNRGLARAERGDNRGAIADFDTALGASPSFAETWASRAVSKAALGDLDGAIADFREAIRISPDRAEYRFNYGLTLGDRGRWDDALSELGEAIRLRPDFAEAYLNRGLALLRIGRAADAAADVRRAKALGYPVDPALLRRLP